MTTTATRVEHHVHEGTVKDVQHLQAELVDRCISLPAEREHGRTDWGCPDVEGEVGRDEPAHSGCLSGPGERQLAVDDDVPATLDCRDNDGDALGRDGQGVGIVQITLDQHRACPLVTFERSCLDRVGGGERANEKVDVGHTIRQQVRGYSVAEVSGGSDEQD